MTRDSRTLDFTRCKIHISRDDDWAIAVVSLDGAFTGGALVEPVPSFLGGIEGKDEVASSYKVANWLGGLTSGALYAFRALKLPRRRLLLSELAGSLRGSGMQALANGACVGVATLCERDSPIVDADGWQIECEVLSPSLPVAGNDNGKSTDSSRTPQVVV